ncbi:ribonuclease HIII [Enterococcus sp. LJL90]
MATIVLKPDTPTYQKILSYYQGFAEKKQVPHAQLFAKKGTTAVTIYNSGKVMFQGPAAEKEAQQWDSSPQASNVSGTATATKKKSAATKPGLPAGFGQLSVIGSDEVGNGSYFGPLVVCAAYAPKEKLAELKALGVRDSKELTDLQIKQIASQLAGLIDYQLLVVPPEKYNAVQPKYNAVHMKVVLHNQAISLLLAKIAPTKPDAILIDQFTPEGNYRKYLAAEKNQVSEKIYFITKGEQYHLAVAAASILCRASFLNELAEESAEVGLQLPSGAGAKSDQVASRILKKGGLDLLGKYAKLHFANTQKAQNLLK